MKHAIKIWKIQTPPKIAVIIIALKFEQCGFTLDQFVKMVQTDPDHGLQCFLKPVCPKAQNHYCASSFSGQLKNTVKILKFRTPENLL